MNGKTLREARRTVRAYSDDRLLLQAARFVILDATMPEREECGDADQWDDNRVMQNTLIREAARRGLTDRVATTAVVLVGAAWLRAKQAALADA